MPYTSLAKINQALKGIKPAVTLAQANTIAGWADSITDVDNPWAVAIANFKKAYETKGGAWVKRKAKEAEMPGLMNIAMQAIETSRAIVNESKVLYELAEAKGVDAKTAANKMLDALESDLNSAIEANSTEPSTVEKDEIAEVSGSLHDMANVIEDCFHAQFSPKDRYESSYSVRDVFLNHPTLGNSVIVRNRDTSQVLSAQYEMTGKGTITFDAPAQWKQVELTYVLVSSNTGEAIQDTGHAVGTFRDATESEIAEAQVISETGRRAPIIVDFAMIKPGPGNKRDNHYYTKEALANTAHVFNGVDVFATNHNDRERNERTKVGKVLSVPTRITEAGEPVAQVLIYDPLQAEKTRNRADENMLETLECSVYGGAMGKPGVVDGKKYYVINALTEGRYLDLVGQGGAGGHAIGVAENNTGGANMPTQEEDKTSENSKDVEAKEKEVEMSEGKTPEVKPPVEPIEPAVENDAPVLLEPEKVKELLAEVHIPDAFKVIVERGTYKDEAEATAAIEAITAEVKKLTGSGLPFGLGGTARTAESVAESQKQLNEKFAEIEKQYSVEHFGK